jgi:Fe-S cluster assembly ATP-binding protein
MSENSYLVIKDLVVAPSSDPSKHILQGISLTVKPGEVHAIMGPNGSGKTTLSYALMGHPSYQIVSGSVTWKGEDLLEYSADQRARLGLFLAFQYPTSIPGLSVASFLRTAMNARRSGLVRDPEFDPSDPVKGGMTMGEFRKLVKEKLTQLKVDEAFMTRYVNDGFSGGEKKRLEMLQMALLKPEMAILDETDSGLDIDALRIVAEGVNTMLSPELGVLVITHYQRLLDYLKPQFVHVLARGRIVVSGGPDLAHRLEREGYAPILAENGINPTADEAATPTAAPAPSA